MRPLAMATGAVQLSSYKTSNECCEKMKPANIFKEAVELAVFKSDWKTVKQLAELYTTTGFSDPEYAGYLKALIANWRETLNAPELPFLICQLPNYMEKHEQPTSSDWAGMREAQTKVAVEVPFCHISTCYDTGEWNDIHPLNKKDLAKRLFLGARKL